MLAHLGLVTQIARKLVRRMPPQVELDDLEAAGVIGLITAAQAFDCDRGVAFGAFARRRVLGAMLDYLRGTDALSRMERDRVRTGDRVFVELQLHDEHGDTVDVVDPLPWPDASCAVALQRDHVRGAIARLPTRERFVIEQHYYAGRDLADLTDELDVGPARVSQIKARALLRLRRWLMS